MSTDIAVVLAAGKGTRMRSSLPKVLHRLAGRSMLDRVLGSLADAGLACPLVVVGYGADQIRAAVGDRAACLDQGEQLGTGHAARVAVESLPPEVDRVVVVHGDEPLIGADALRALLDEQVRTGAAVVLLTTEAEDTRGFGRVVRTADGSVRALVQEPDLTDEERAHREVNLGAYAFDAAFLRTELPGLHPHLPGGEYYLTDLVARAAESGAGVAAVTVPGGTDIMGVNDLIHLEHAGRALYRRTNRALMTAGVTIVDSASTFIEDTVTIGPDSVIHPFTVITGNTTIGPGCVIGPGSHIIESRLGERCLVLSSTLEFAEVADDVRIGPYSHLRPGAQLGAGVEIGNYAEVKGSTLGSGTRMHHMSYVGDAQVGANVNIGAGTVFCNYDGVRKHRTVVGDNVFLGSDTMLRAPVTVGHGASTGAGSVVLHDIPPGGRVAGVPARPIRSPAEQPAPDDHQDDDPSTRATRGA